MAAEVVAKPPLDFRVERFDVTDAILRDGVHELGLKDIPGLHLGMEEVMRPDINLDPRNVNPHFSLHLREKNVREILNQLCNSDPRYTWSEDGATINISPIAVTRDASYLLDLQIRRIEIEGIPDPDQALTPLSKLFPEQQIGYSGPGLADNTYTEPWTDVFEHLTVRQFINRLAEHMGPRTSWIWQGGSDDARMFTFWKLNTSVGRKQ